MKNIEEYSEVELKNELGRRKIEKAQAERPELIDKPDFTKLILLCDEYVDGCINKNLDEDQVQWIFEEAMTAVFGDKIFSVYK